MKGSGNWSFKYLKEPFIKIFQTHIPYDWYCFNLDVKEYYFPVEGYEGGYIFCQNGI